MRLARYVCMYGNMYVYVLEDICQCSKSRMYVCIHVWLYGMCICMFIFLCIMRFTYLRYILRVGVFMIRGTHT